MNNLLDVRKMYEGLLHDYSLDAAIFAEGSNTTSVRLVGRDGLPMSLAWADTRGLPGRVSSRYGLFTYNPIAPTLHRQLSISQQVGESGGLLQDEDWSDYFAGIATTSVICKSERLNSEELDRELRVHTFRAYILNRTDAKVQVEFGNKEKQLAAVREHALALVAQGNHLGIIDQVAFRRYAAL